MNNNNMGVANCCNNNGENLIWILILIMLLCSGGLGSGCGCNGFNDSFIIIIFLVFFMSGNNSLF